MAKKAVATPKTAKKNLDPTHENIAREYVLAHRDGRSMKSVAEMFDMSYPNFTAKIKSMRKAGVNLPESSRKRLGEDDVTRINDMLANL